jgi:hypothetical protein
VAACLIVSRVVPSRQLFGEIDLPLLILFAALFVVNDAFARTGLPEEAVRQLASYGLLPDRVTFLEPIALLLSNTIGNVPAVVMILKVWQGIPPGVLVGLAILSTLAGNLLLVGSLANLIVVDTGSQMIRMIVISTNEVTTLAGAAGITGSTDGIGEAAHFNYPSATTTDGTYAYITDTSNKTIRKIDISSKQVSTIAGTARSGGISDGDRSMARIGLPFGITRIDAGLFVMDMGTIRRIE